MIRRAAFYFAIVSLLLVFAVVLLSCSEKENQNDQQERSSMILEPLDNAANYYDAHPAFQKAFEFLQQADLADKPLGRYELEGDKLFCTISKDNGRKQEDAKLEAHKKYIDIQYVIGGDETYGWKLFKECTDVDQAYEDSKDIMFFNDEPATWTKVPPGSFVIFFAGEDAHAPVIGEGEIHKVVIKILKEY